MNNEIDYYKNLATVMFKTRGARFTAATALYAKEKCSIGVTAFLAVYTLSWAIISLSYPEIFASSHARFYNAVSAIASLALLVITLMDFAFGRSVRAEKFNQNALSISILLRELERELASSSPNVLKLSEIAEKYEEQVFQTQINHTPADYKLWLYSSAKPEGIILRFIFCARAFLFRLWFYFSSLFIHILLVALIVASTIWYTFFEVFKFQAF